MDTTIGDRLHILREREDLTQEEIASYLHISQQNYSRYEKSQSELPLRYLEELTNYYSVSADYLLGKTDFEQIPPMLSEPLCGKITIGEFLNYILKFDKTSRRHLIEYTKYLHWLEMQGKEKEKRGEL